jgi:RNA polymerase sigma-70 factor (ECF subfamily)
MFALAPEIRVQTAAVLIDSDAETPVDEAPSDHALMLAVRAGDLDRLGDLFERHHRSLYGFFVHLTGNRTASEDLVQFVFERMLKYRHTYRDEGKFTAWIYHLARTVAADHFRRGQRLPQSLAPEDLPDVADEAPDAGATAETTEDLALMREALAALSPDHREVLVLHRLQHLPHAEIARLLDCREGTVKVRLHRALAALRERFFHLRQEHIR